MSDDASAERSPHREILGVINRNGQEKGYWTRIGTAFENSDGSWYLKFDYFPSHPEVKLHLREKRDWDRPGG